MDNSSLRLQCEAYAVSSDTTLPGGDYSENDRTALNYRLDEKIKVAGIWIASLRLHGNMINL